MARQMKDSGIEWIGEIPAHFQKYRIKNVAELHGRIGFRGYTTDDLVGAGEGPITLSPSNIRDMSMNYDKCSYITWAKYDESPEIQVRDGDILMVKTGSSYGKAAMVTALPMEATINPQLIVMSNFKVVPRFLNYCFHTEIILSQIENAVVGGTIPTMAQEKINNFFFFAPPLPEQQRIAAFLDRKCAEIDAVIERTKATIEEYKKLKQAVITEAVTKGVRGPRPMKDSGIEWVAEIVDSWKMSRIGLHYSIVLGKMLCDKQLTDEYTLEPYFCAANIHFDGVSQEQLKQMWFSPAEKASYCVQNGDLLVVEGGAGAGGAAIVKTLEQPTYVQNSVMIVRGLAGQSNRYLRYWIECLVKKGYVDVVCNKATIPHFTKDKLATMPVPVIPVAEMEEIADYLDDKCAALDTLIAKKTALLTELETYKKSLIYEYVTGKKEV